MTRYIVNLAGIAYNGRPVSRTPRRGPKHLEAGEYRQLAAFRFALRRFLRFSEAAAEKVGLTAQQYQALLVVCAAPAGAASINHLAHELLIRHNSAVGLVDRLTAQGLLARAASAEDRRKVSLRLTPQGDRVLARLAEVHREELRRIGPQLRRQLDAIAEEGAGTKPA